MEGDLPMAGDRRNPSLLYPVAAPAPSSLSDRMIHLTFPRGRLRTPCKVKPRVRFEPHYRRRKSSPLAGDVKLRAMVSDILYRLEPRRVRTPHRCPRLEDPPLAPEQGIGESNLTSDQGICAVLVDVTNLMQSLSLDAHNAEALHNNEDAPDVEWDDADGSNDEYGEEDVGDESMDPQGAEPLHSNGNTSDAKLGEYLDSDGSNDEHVAEDVRDENFMIEATEGSLTASCFELPMWIYMKLHTYQREGIQWLWSWHCSGTGGILADDMGLGKTKQVATFLAGLFHSGLIKRALIVCPKTILAQWSDELSSVGLKENVRRFLTSNKNSRNSDLHYVFEEGGVLLTTYDIVRHNYEVIRGDSYDQIDDDEEGDIWNYVVVDEGHLIKEPKTKRAQSLHAIPCIHRIVITGTPVQNSLMEMWALFSFCCPEVLGDMENFKTTYEKIIVRGTNKNATCEEKQTSSDAAEELRNKIRPYFLRRMKGEVKFDAGPSEQTSLSNKHELVIWLKLTDFQRKMYSAFLKGGQVDLSKDGSIFSAISTLKKICDHPGSLDISKYTDKMSNNPESAKFLEMIRELKDTDTAGTLEIDKTASCKLSFIMCLLKVLIGQEHQILIFSETLYMLDCIEKAINLEGYKFLRIDGKTEMSERHRLVEDFQGHLGAPIFLLSTKVGGLGVTLTKATRVIIVNPSWNPSTDSQSVDRAYRYGQTKDVIVYRLMTSGTLEEKIYKLQVFKGALFQIATKKGRPKRYFNRDEAEEVLSLPKEGFDVSQTQLQLEEEHRGQSIDVSLRTHIETLEQQGIAGVSQHSFLFRETAILPPG